MRCIQSRLLYVREGVHFSLKLGVIFVCGTKVAPARALLLFAEAASVHPTHGFLSTLLSCDTRQGVKNAVLILLWAIIYFFTVFNL